MQFSITRGDAKSTEIYIAIALDGVNVLVHVGQVRDAFLMNVYLGVRNPRLGGRDSGMRGI